VCLDTGADKDSVLEQYRDSGLYWVEDKIKNAEVGRDIGLRSLLMSHGHNLDFKENGIRAVKNWREIYEIITA
jgi:hypothetical protein